MASGRWPVTLEHGPVRLRPVRIRDERAWAEIRQRGEAWFRPWDASRPPESLDDPASFATLTRRLLAKARQGAILPWAVEYTPESGKRRFVGQVTVGGITHGSASWAQVGYWIDPAWAGRGIVPTAVALACDYCFGSLRLHRIEIAIRPENANSLAVVRKLGFRYEGRRQRYMHVDGDWRDHEMFVLHREEIPGGVLNRYLRRPADR